jgi:hypothetical protein
MTFSRVVQEWSQGVSDSTRGNAKWSTACWAAADLSFDLGERMGTLEQRTMLSSRAIRIGL